MPHTNTLTDQRMNPLQQEILSLMVDRRMTYPELSRRSGVKKQTLHNLLSPTLGYKGRIPRVETLEKIARALGVSKRHFGPALLETYFGRDHHETLRDRGRLA